MSTADRTHVRQIFLQVADLPPVQRAEALARACGSDHTLRAEVEGLLRADGASAQAANAPTVSSASPLADAAATSAAPVREGPGSRIGPYKVLQLIGEGGFGSVFMAEQSEPVKRKVALKIIKLGMDTRQVVARFEQERQALAMMDHPNIARVLDAGATETGRPFFVMELVKGDPIVEYCDRNNLSIEHRLELFEQVCLAVQHAHTKGIIHRDLKPSNILVSTLDGRPITKVIDFGIAKATSSQLTEKTLFTEHRQLIGTPEYMSPEQAEGSMDIDTRTDVYSLGVLLYELLTGTTPFAGRDLRSAAYAEIQRIIREVDPPKPSTRLSQSAESIASIAVHRHTEPRKLGTLIRGELDWIVMRALEKDRHRRYETASGLASDIRRYLAGDAVLAAPPGAAYRLRKFIRRNRFAVGTGLAVSLSLIVGLAGFAWQFTVARAQRDRAVVAEAAARARADDLVKVSEFQSQMLSEINTTDAGIKLMQDVRARFAAAIAKDDTPPADTAARIARFSADLDRVNATDAAAELIDSTILKPAIAAVDSQFAGQPIVDAKLRATLAGLYRDLGLYEPSLHLCQQALTTRRTALGDVHPDTLTSIADMGVVLQSLGRFDEAQKFHNEAYEGRKRVLGNHNIDTFTSAGSLGNYYRSMGRYDEAEPLLRDALEGTRRLNGPDARATLIAMNTLGYLFIMQGKVAEAEPLWREAYERGRKSLGENHPDVLVWTNNVAGVLQAQGKLAESEGYFRQAVDKYRKVKGETHPDTLQAISGLVNSFWRQGKTTEAETLAVDTLAQTRSALGNDHPNTLNCINNLAGLLSNRGRLAEAEALFRESLAVRQRLLGPDHPDAISSAGSLARCLSAQSKTAEAEALYRETLARGQRINGTDHPDTLVTEINLGNLLVAAKRPDEAEPLIRHAVQVRRARSGEDHPETLVAVSNLASLVEAQGRLEEALEINRDVTARFRKSMGDRYPSTINSVGHLSRVLLLNGKAEEAEPLAREALAGIAASLGEDHPSTAMSKRALGNCLVALQRFSEAEPLLIEAERILSETTSSRHTLALESLVALYSGWTAADSNGGHEQKLAEWTARLRARSESAGQP